MVRIRRVPQLAAAEAGVETVRRIREVEKTDLPPALQGTFLAEGIENYRRRRERREQ
jgi:hypothetical protein